MTFSVMRVMDNQPVIVGTLWAKDEAGAQAIVPALFAAQNCERLAVCRTEEREIPLRINDVPVPTFC
jgi:hypothetical protein